MIKAMEEYGAEEGQLKTFGHADEMMTAYEEAMAETAETDPTARIGAATASEKLNEDFFTADMSGMAIVCDGVGSSGYGIEGASLANEFLAEKVSELSWIDNHETAEKALAEVLREAHQRVLQEQAATGHDMVSTASVVKFVNEADAQWAVIGNVGDSPIYLMRGEELTELTNYHQELLPRDQRAALGKAFTPAPQTLSVQLEPGDRILVSSNGLRKNDPDKKKMRKILAKTDDPQAAAEALVAKVSGISRDARTAVVLEAA
jgi:protein phosphatase